MRLINYDSNDDDTEPMNSSDEDWYDEYLNELINNENMFAEDDSRSTDTYVKIINCVVVLNGLFFL